jgi:hypothetical protein
MGQSCNSSVFACVDGNVVNSLEVMSEPSKIKDLHKQLLKIQARENDEKNEGIEKPLEMYEKKVGKKEGEKKNGRISLGSEDGKGFSPKLKIISSNVGEKSVNIIDRVDRTAETERSGSSVFYNTIGKNH